MRDSRIEGKLRGRARRNGGWLITLCVFVCVAALALAALGSANQKVTRAQAALLEEALRAAAVNGYANRGRYPTLAQIESDYGVVVDREKFHVRYSSFAYNLFPEISVDIRGEEK